MNIPEKDYLSIDEACEALSMHRNTVYKFIKLGLLPAEKIGLKKWVIKKKEIINLLENGVKLREDNGDDHESN